MQSVEHLVHEVSGCDHSKRLTSGVHISILFIAEAGISTYSSLIIRKIVMVTLYIRDDSSHVKIASAPLYRGKIFTKEIGEQILIEIELGIWQDCQACRQVVRIGIKTLEEGK